MGYMKLFEILEDVFNFSETCSYGFCIFKLKINAGKVNGVGLELRVFGRKNKQIFNKNMGVITVLTSEQNNS